MGRSKVIFWDFDETLAFREVKWTGTLLAILGKKRIRGLRYEDISPLLGEIYPWAHPDTPHAVLMKGKEWWAYMNDGIASALTGLGLDPTEARGAAALFRGEYLRPDAWRVYDDTLPALAEARERGYRNMILSNHVPELGHLVDEVGLSGLVDEVFTSGTIGHEKPSREIFLHALSAAGEPGRAVMVGDNYRSDIIGARNAGIPALLVRTPNLINHPHYSASLGPVPAMVDAMI